MEYFGVGSPTLQLTEQEAGILLDGLLARLGSWKRVLLIPPDATRHHSWAGRLTGMLYKRLAGSAVVAILPALGTHAPMSPDEMARMFPGVPQSAFVVHNWRRDLVRLGEVPADFIRTLSEGRLDYSIPVEVNRLVVSGNWDVILSIGQVVPHEVAGIANHNKNIYVGTGGQETINKTHFLGAVYGMERILGRVDSPVRDVFNYADAHCAGNLPIVYLLTVRATDGQGELVTRGLYAGDDAACFRRAAALCQSVNLALLKEGLDRVLVYLPPEEFTSTWLGNKAIYRTRMAIADGGELIILAPGVRRFGEDAEIDRLIRKYGYRGTPSTLECVARHKDLAANLSAAAHLIHGSSEGRFRITYCADGLSRDSVEQVGFSYADPRAMMRRYDPAILREGMNDLGGGERVYFISNPALGLWGLQSQFSGNPLAAGGRPCHATS